MFVKNLVLFTLLFFLSGFTKYLPLNRLYVPLEDIGFKQYNSPSLYKSGKYVLTFDDGPHDELTPKILDILKDHNVKATFFIVTSRLNKNRRKIALRALKEGHTLGSHHHTHDHNNHRSEEEFKRKLKTSLLSIVGLYKEAEIKLPQLYYRFPFGEYGKAENYHHLNALREVSIELFKKNCTRFVFWDHDSSDWLRQLDSNLLYENLVSFDKGGKYNTYKVIQKNGKKEIALDMKEISGKQGGVILLHDIQRKTPLAIKNFLVYLKNSNQEVISLTEVDEYHALKHSCHH